VRAARADPAAQQRGPGLLLRVGEQIEQDRQLGAVLELPRQELERAGVQRPDELLVGEAQEVL
jgi:hypothetical protein